MIGTLLRYEWEAVRRPVGALLGWAGVVFTLAMLPVAFGVPALGQLGTMVGYLVCVAMPIGCAVIVLAGYWTSMYGRVGYFTMTLPVRGRALYLVKTVHGFLVVLAGTILALGGALIMMAAGAWGDGVSVASAFDGLRNALASTQPAVMAVVVVALVFWLASMIGQATALLSLGGDGRVNHLGLAAPLIGFIILYTVNQVLGFAATVWLPGAIVVAGPDAGSWTWGTMWPDFLAAVQTGADASVVGLGSFAVTVAITVVVAVVACRSIESQTSLR